MGKKNGEPEYSNMVPPFGFVSYEMTFDSLYKHYYDQLCCIVFKLLDFSGIPETIDETFLKYCIFIMGKAVFFRLDQDIIEQKQSGVIPLKSGDLVAMNGNTANTQTAYYMYRDVLVNNPAFSKSYNLTPGIDCEVVYCTEPDKFKLYSYGGLYKLIARTATILADNDLSINIIQKNTRLTNVLGADDEPTRISAEAAVQAMYEGKPYMVAQKSLVSDLASFPMTQTTANKDIVQLIEARQYIYSHFYESLGLQTHDNMKKERLITEEINDNEELSALNIDDIIDTVQEGLERVNAMFGTNISVSLNPIIQKAHEMDETEPADDREDLTDAAAGTEAGTEEPPEDQTEDAPEQEEPPEEIQQEDDADQTEDAPEQEEPPEEIQQEDDADQTEDTPEQGEPPEEIQQEDDADQTEDAPEQEEPPELPPIEINVTAEDSAEVSIEINQDGGDNDVRKPDPLA